MREKITIIILVLSTINLFGQDESWKYFGQTPPGMIAELFAPEIVNHLAHSSPTFTPDCREIYWSTVSGENETRKIYFVKYENGSWSEKKLAPFSGKFHDDQPFISYDGQKLFFGSKRTQKDDGTLGLDLWSVDKTINGWSEPIPIDNYIGFWTPTVTRSGTIYFMDNINGIVGICRSEFKNGKYSDSEFLPEQINQKDCLNWCPFIAPDESYLIFSSDRKGELGDGDLFISFMDENGKWKEAINMGSSINTDRQERFPGVSPDGKYLFFTRWHSEPYYHDLYWIDAKIITDLKNKK